MGQKCNCLWVSKGIKATNGCLMSFWGINFNMPTPDLSSGDVCFNTGDICSFYGEGCCYNFSAFTRGQEAWLGTAMYRYCVCENECYNGIFTHCLKFADPYGTVFAYSSALNCVDLPAPGAGYWSYQVLQYYYHIGVASWEIWTSGNYCVYSCATCYSGDDLSIATTSCTMPAINVPGATSTGDDRGVIWVEGTDLHFRPAQDAEKFEQSICGSCCGCSLSPSGTPGAIWIDTNHNLHWTSDDGTSAHQAPWKICQFCSWFSNSSGSNPSPGAAYAGAIWADEEFGYSHLAYIGCDGNKYITGGGNYPYVTP